MQKYNHDYGTIIYAMTAGMIATFHAMNRDNWQGGITGFQAGCIMWEFITRFMHIEGPMKLLSYEHMLYPQYEYDFNKTISEERWSWLQKEAKSHLREAVNMHPDVKAHQQSIVDGKIPFGYTIEKKEE
jgi:hypothetical protein